MIRESKRQCLSPTTQTLLVNNDTHLLSKGNQSKLTVSDKIQQLAFVMVENNQCIFELGSDGSITMTPLKSYQLPNEIIAQVLDHVTDSQRTLYQCTLASKQCYAIANPLLWKAPHDVGSVFIDCMNRMPCDRRDALGQHIRVLKGWFPPVNDMILRLVPYLSELTHLDGLDTITSEDAHLIIRSCPRLKSFNFQVTHLSALVLADIPNYLHHLEAFHWYPWFELSPSFLDHLIPCSLRHLDLYFEDLMPNVTALATIKTFDRLTSLKIRQETENSLKALLDPSAFPHLTILKLDWCYDTDDDTMITFLKTHPMLEQLHLNKFFSLTDATLDAICGLSRLTYFAIWDNEHITSEAVQRVIKACPLTHLLISECEQLVDDDLLVMSCMGAFDEDTLGKVRRWFGLV